MEKKRHLNALYWGLSIAKHHFETKTVSQNAMFVGLFVSKLIK